MADCKIIARMVPSVLEVPASQWNTLLAQQSHPTPFMRHEYLAAMHSSGSALPSTGWTPQFMTLWDSDELVAACPAYLKTHSYGEYVFDWAWADAYRRHGMAYYPKLLVAVPFTPVPGTRLMARDAACRTLLLKHLQQWADGQGISSVHMLFASDEDMAASQACGWMQRQTVQFHWQNANPLTQAPYADFDGFLASLSQDKRKKIRQERRKVADAGVRFRWVRGSDITQADWDFFYRCYERTYLEHGNPPYLSRAFFAQMAQAMPESWLLFIAERSGTPIATSLIAISAYDTTAAGHFDHKSVAFGRYWGALERVDCLHFEACYYQPLQWCIEHGIQSFEGGAQGEHKMARALLPTPTHSAHWLAHPAFANAVQDFLEREGAGVQAYVEHLEGRSPFKTTTTDKNPL